MKMWKLIKDFFRNKKSDEFIHGREKITKEYPVMSRKKGAEGEHDLPNSGIKGLKSFFQKKGKPSKKVEFQPELNNEQANLEGPFEKADIDKMIIGKELAKPAGVQFETKASVVSSSEDEDPARKELRSALKILGDYDKSKPAGVGETYEALAKAEQNHPTMLKMFLNRKKKR